MVVRAGDVIESHIKLLALKWHFFVLEYLFKDKCMKEIVSAMYITIALSTK